MQAAIVEAVPGSVGQPTPQDLRPNSSCSAGIGPDVAEIIARACKGAEFRQAAVCHVGQIGTSHGQGTEQHNRLAKLLGGALAQHAAGDALAQLLSHAQCETAALLISQQYPDQPSRPR